MFMIVWSILKHSTLKISGNHHMFSLCFTFVGQSGSDSRHGSKGNVRHGALIVLVNGCQNQGFNQVFPYFKPVQFQWSTHFQHLFNAMKHNVKWVCMKQWRLPQLAIWWGTVRFPSLITFKTWRFRTMAAVLRMPTIAVPSRNWSWWLPCRAPQQSMVSDISLATLYRGWDWCPNYWGFVSHHQTKSVGNYISNSWVMWNIGTFTKPWCTVVILKQHPCRHFWISKMSSICARVLTQTFPDEKDGSYIWS